MHNERTLKTIYIEKIHDILEEKELLYVVKVLFLSCIAFLITFALTYTEKFIELSQRVFLYENMIIGKSFITFYIVFNYETLFENYQSYYKDLKKKIKKVNIQKSQINKNDTEKICGIDIEKIITHLFSEKSFKVHDIESKFGIPRNQYNILAKKLEEIKILKRGENNSRVLNEEYSKEQIMKAFIYSEGKIENIFIHCELEEGTTHSFTREPLNA